MSGLSRHPAKVLVVRKIGRPGVRISLFPPLITIEVYYEANDYCRRSYFGRCVSYN